MCFQKVGCESHAELGVVSGNLCKIWQLQSEQDASSKQEDRGCLDINESPVSDIHFESEQITDINTSSANNTDACYSSNVDALLREFMENPACFPKSAEPERHIRSGVSAEPREFSRSRSRIVPRRIVIESFWIWHPIITVHKFRIASDLNSSLRAHARFKPLNRLWRRTQ